MPLHTKQRLQQLCPFSSRFSTRYRKSRFFQVPRNGDIHIRSSKAQSSIFGIRKFHFTFDRTTADNVCLSLATHRKPPAQCNATHYECATQWTPSATKEHT